MGEARYSGGEEGTQMQKVVREFGLAKFVQISPLREGRGWGEWRLAYVNKEGKLSLEEDCAGRQYLLLRFDEPAGYYHTGQRISSGGGKPNNIPYPVQHLCCRTGDCLINTKKRAMS